MVSDVSAVNNVQKCEDELFTVYDEDWEKYFEADSLFT